MFWDTLHKNHWTGFRLWIFLASLLNAKSQFAPTISLHETNVTHSSLWDFEFHARADVQPRLLEHNAFRMFDQLGLKARAQWLHWARDCNRTGTVCQFPCKCKFPATYKSTATSTNEQKTKSIPTIEQCAAEECETWAGRKKEMQANCWTKITELRNLFRSVSMSFSLSMMIGPQIDIALARTLQIE